MSTGPKLDPDGVLHGLGDPIPADILPTHIPKGTTLKVKVTPCPTRHADGLEPGVTAKSKKRGKVGE